MKTKNYLVYTLTRWNEPPRARHQVTNELKKEGKVYFVECNKLGAPRIEVKQVEENVYTITPYYWVPFKVRYRTPVVNDHYHHWLLTKIKELQLDFEMVINFEFTAPSIHDFFENVIFYCNDDLVGFGNFNPFFINRYHAKMERKAAERAKMCIVTSDYMHTKISRYNPATHVVPLGAPSITFNEIKPPQKRPGLPVLGLVGYLDLNLNYELIEALLEKFIIVFIGPANKTNRERLSRHPNARLLGPKTGKELYQCLQEVDVCIAPYDETKLNKGATPNKMWLYLAMGKPAVITTMPNIRNWRFEEGTVYICENKDFVATCQKAYEEDTLELSQKRIELSKANSWESRVQTVKDLFYQQIPLQANLQRA